MESRFLEPSVSRTSRYLEPNLGFASLKLYNFTPDFSNPRFLETPDNSNQFWLPWDKLTLDNSNLRKFQNHLVRMSITFTPLTNWHSRISCFLHFNHTTSKPQICHQSGRYKKITEQKFPYLIVFLKLLSQYIDKFWNECRRDFRIRTEHFDLSTFISCLLLIYDRCEFGQQFLLLRLGSCVTRVKHLVLWTLSWPLSTVYCKTLILWNIDLNGTFVDSLMSLYYLSVFAT